MGFSHAVNCILLAGGLTACGPAYPEPCSLDKLRAIELRYQAELVAACGGSSKCPEREAIDERFRAEREAWVRCDPPKGER